MVVLASCRLTVLVPGVTTPNVNTDVSNTGVMFVILPVNERVPAANVPAGKLNTAVLAVVTMLPRKVAPSNIA